MEKLFQNFDKKYEFLKKTLNTKTKEPSHAIEQTKAKQSELTKFFKEKIEKNNAEGLIVRDNSSIYKIKQEETADLLITGYTVSDKANQIRSVSLGVYLNENEIVHIGACGNFTSDALRKDLYKQLTKLKVKSNFQKIASNGSAYNFVKPSIVCEVKLLEFQGDKTNDQPIRHLKYEFSDNSLNATGRARSVSILNSSILNIRKDKKPNYEDCGLKQIIRIVSIPLTLCFKISLNCFFFICIIIYFNFYSLN